METEKLKHLLEAYFSAEATAAQEAELKGMLQAMDMAALAPDIAADARLARTLLTAGGEGVAVNRDIQGQRRNSVAELSEDDRQTVHEEWQI